MPAPTTRNSLPLPTGRGWWLVAAGIAAGLAIFLALWIAQRSDRDPYRADVQPPAAATQVFQPLPTPPRTGPAMGAGIPEPPASGDRLEEPAATRPPPVAANPVPGEAMPATGPIELSASSPVPISSPGPAYPPRALRRGESGEVMLRIQVDARGVPAQVDIAASSGSRDLDRAAQRAARRWRFRPAMQDGSPVAGTVTVPIRFDSGR
ncbi:TonB family protein [Luteimonas sp. MJ246]|uniref:energy transducer TonB n=1 Tax=Luteimonas sp. MJ174 TaxID=3129237 RepID=UPI0031BA62B5